MNEKFRIAYVDDDLNNLNHYKTILAKNFHIDTYLRSSDFISQLEIKDYDCYIFDLYMPVCDGLQLLDKIRTHPEKKSIPVFIITTNSSDEARVNSYKAGAADYLDRLIKENELITRIESRIVLYRGAAAFVQIGNLKCHLNNLLCEINSQALDLTLLEYKILIGLVQKFPAKTTKNDFVNSIWGASALNENNLNTHLYNLRRKLSSWDHEITNHRVDGFWITKKP